MEEFVIETRKGSLTEAEALDSDLDVIPSLFELEHLYDFREYLCQQRPQIQQLVSRHLGIPTSQFTLSEEAEWISGCFNICLPINVHVLKRGSGLPRRAMIRFPLAFNVGEAFSEGAMEEKLRCEAASYIWLRRYCPGVPIPRLLGMGLPGRRSFTSIDNESIWNRICWHLKRGIAWWYNDTLAPYIAHERGVLMEHGYLLIEANLYRGLSRIMLDLARLPQPRIGSWTLDDRGVISLTNRPLSDLTFFWNRHKVPTGVSQTLTYNSTEPFIHDMLRYHDLRMRHQPNAILGRNDGIFQLSALTALRSLLPHFWNQDSRHGPFNFSFNDMHQSNIFVDENWNITSLIDLEFASVKPLQMVQVPSWLNDRGVDELEGEHLEEYDSLYHSFVQILEEEEKVRRIPTTYSESLRENWKSGRLWYTMALESLNGFPTIFEQHLQPKFFEKFELGVEGLALARLWGGEGNVERFIKGKLEDQEGYRRRIKEIFAERGEPRL